MHAAPDRTHSAPADTSELRQALAAAEAARDAAEAECRFVLDSIGEVVFRTDAEGCWTMLTAAWEAVTGRPVRDALGVSFLEFVHPDDRAEQWRAFESLVGGQCEMYEHTVRYLTPDGRCRVVEARVRTTADAAGRISGTFGTLHDVTARSALEAELAHQAYHDALTGLANRAQLRLRVERALDHAARSGRSPDHVALLLLDLDGFKLVNDGGGHAAGDALLGQVAERLLAATRGSDLVARIGGDEFGVLLERVRGDADLVVIAERIAQALREPFVVLGTTVVVGASVGIARGADGAIDDPVTGTMAPVDALFRNADLALYEAKARGKGQHALFEPLLHAAALERVSMESALRRALDRGELRLVYQPIIELGSARPVAVEALVRWDHPERGPLPPSRFIPLAEETGLIIPLGRWVLNEACRDAARWAAHAGHPLAVTVNVSGRQIQHPSFVGDVATALVDTGLPPRCLILELTETAVVQHPDVALARLTAVKRLGARLAVDDFGTGYSALSYLQQFPFDVLKIDKSFVDRVAEGGRNAALTSAIVALSDALALHTVAEGVETPAQREALAAMGCGYAQGFHFARPLSSDDVEALLAE